MAVTLPIVGNSTGTWGTILNTAITDIDNRLITATSTNGTQDASITDLKNRVTTLEGKPSTQGMMLLATSTNRPAAVVGQIVLETDTGFQYYVQTISGVATRIPWPGSYVAQLRQTVTQSLATSGTGYAITLDTEDFDRLNAANGTSKYTATLKGTYEFTGAVSFGTNATGYRATAWARNGVVQNASRISIAPVPATVGTIVTARATPITLNVGDYVELYGYQNSGGALSTDVGAGPYQSSMMVRYLGYGGN